MKTIGLIGGISWYSTIDYYRIINENVNQSLGNNASAKLLLYSVNYDEIVMLTKKGDWKAIATIISNAAKNLEKAGADCMVLCANTMHIIADQVQASIKIPLLHIADVVVEAIAQQQLKTVLLLGTKYTMEARFYADKLKKNGIKIVVPHPWEMGYINNSIYNELGKGLLLPETKRMYMDIIIKQTGLGVQGVILGCTEIPLLIQKADCTIPLFDTTFLHATAAAHFALGKVSIEPASNTNQV